MPNRKSTTYLGYLLLDKPLHLVKNLFWQWFIVMRKWFNRLSHAKSIDKCIQCFMKFHYFAAITNLTLSIHDDPMGIDQKN